MKNGAEIEISDYRRVMETDITGEHLNSISFNRVRSRPVGLQNTETNLEAGFQVFQLLRLLLFV